MESDRSTTYRSSFSQGFFLLFQRGVALYLIVLALACWAALIGFSHGGAGRFDLVHPDVRFVEPILAVGFPVAALGLWFGVGWGAVIWFIGAGIQIVSHGGYPRIFGEAPVIITLHVILILVYIALWIYRMFIRWH
ncbi:hypothetical protein FJU08_18620 [Martelella alba]|uniref:Uncharacterized protein n=1 Tax=Martelella alba TaxID=2590451 RepID=A0A506U857_9HYPH|nr:DUF6163 family protein [Martelella alba]TPW28057.1 hypothetical protein FJU08_18620 [Martelella alba]